MKMLVVSAALLSGLLASSAFAQTNSGPGITAPSGSSSMKMSRTDCDAAWMKLDSGNTGSVSQAQSQGMISDFKTADANGDGKLSQMEFRQACDRGLVSSTASTGPGGGTAGGTQTNPEAAPRGSFK